MAQDIGIAGSLTWMENLGHKSKLEVELCEHG